jgi:hypothetical protein
MKPLITLFLFILIMIPGVYSQNKNATPSNIPWYSFEWVEQEKTWFDNIPGRIIVGKFLISSLPDALALAINPGTPFSHVSTQTYESMVYRNPSIADQLEEVQRTVAHRERLLKQVDISINRQLLGAENIYIQGNDDELPSPKVKGTLGFGMFHRNGKILIIDNTTSRFTSLDDLPQGWQDHAIFIPMKVESGILVISVTINGKPVEMFFDGSSRPATVFYHKGTYRQLASKQSAPEALHHFNGRNMNMIKGSNAGTDILFGQLPLASLPVFFSKERTPAAIRGTLSRASFDNYIMIFDYKNSRFGIMKPEAPVNR